MRAALAALLVTGACSFSADYADTHYACDPRAPVCPDGQTCSRDGVCGEARGGGHHDDPDGGAPDAEVTSSSSPDAAPGVVVLTFGERPDADVRYVTRDTYVNASYPTSNFGGDGDASFDADPLQYAFLSFDLSGAPAGAQVVGAALTLYVNDPLESGDAVIAPVLESWSENSATFVMRSSNLPWAAPGGTVGQLVQIFTPRAVGTYTMTLPPSLVQSWIDQPAQNYGVRFLSTSTDGRGAVWNTSESSPSDERPLLQLTLMVP